MYDVLFVVDFVLDVVCVVVCDLEFFEWFLEFFFDLLWRLYEWVIDEGEDGCCDGFGEIVWWCFV